MEKLNLFNDDADFQIIWEQIWERFVTLQLDGNGFLFPKGVKMAQKRAKKSNLGTGVRKNKKSRSQICRIRSQREKNPFPKGVKITLKGEDSFHGRGKNCSQSWKNVPTDMQNTFPKRKDSFPSSRIYMV